jgi:hypothetical protein
MIAWLALRGVGACAMWIAIPITCLYVGSKIEEAGGSSSVGGLVMLIEATASIVGAVLLLAAINRGYQRARVRRGYDDTGTFPLEVTLVCTLVAFAIAAAVFLLGLEGNIPDGG